MNMPYFFDRIRRSVFGGKLTQKQVDGINKIINYRNTTYPKMPDAELAYLLATVTHETAFTMQPVTEYGSAAYLRSKKYWPWIGRGLIQITWKTNYAKYGITNPDDALKWPLSLKIAFDGMIFGRFTGKKLSDYIVPGKTPNFVGARSIINGTDKAKLIAGYANSYLDAITQSKDGAV
jgi:hypothetical protein